MDRGCLGNLRSTAAILRSASAIIVTLGGILWLGSVKTSTQTTGKSALRTVWGEPDLMGVWKGEKLGFRGGRDTFNLTQLERLYRPDAQARMKQMSGKDDPSLKCMPQSFPHAAVLGWPIQILQSPNRLFVFSEAFHTYRIIPTTGQHQPLDHLIPMWLGDSAAHWDGDTLVVDVLSFNGQTWLASSQDKPTRSSTGAWPTSDSLHVVERWRRVDADTLE